MQTIVAPPLVDMQPIVEQLVEQFRPQRVVLFGSLAYGQPHEGSDIDLLVVTTNPPSRLDGWRYAHSIASPLPLQLWFMVPEEFSETRDVVGGLAYPAHHWGKVLYEQEP